MSAAMRERMISIMVLVLVIGIGFLVPKARRDLVARDAANREELYSHFIKK